MKVQEPVQPSLSKQSAWILSAKIISFVFNLILPLIIVRYFTQDKVGVYRQAFLVIANAAAILPLGFSMSAYYFLNRRPEKRSSTIFNILLFNAATGGIACFVLILFPQVIGNLFQDGEMLSLAPLIGIVIWLWIFSAFLETAALANREVKLATKIIIFTQLSKTAIMVAAIMWFGSVQAIVYAVMLQCFGQTLVLFLYLNSRFPGWWSSFDFKFLREQLIYTLPFGLAGLLYTARSDIHNYFVGYWFDPAEFAIYAYGCFQLPLIRALYESISAVLLPRMSELQAHGEIRKMLLISLSGVEKLALVYFPVFVFLFIVSNEFITTLFTQNFAGSSPIFRINLLILPFYCLILDPLERSFKELGVFITKIRILLLTALVISLYYGIQHLQLTGTIAIVVLMIITERVIILWKVLSFLGVGRSDVYLLRRVSRIALAATSSGIGFLGFYWLMKDILLAACLELSRLILDLFGAGAAGEFMGGTLFLAICFAVFVLLYVSLANRLGIIEPEDKAKFISAVSKIADQFRAVRLRLINGRPAGEEVKSES